MVAGVIGGLLEAFIGFWVSAQSSRAQAVFLIIWAGLLALFRGVFEIVLAFEMRSAQSRLESADPGRAIRWLPLPDGDELSGAVSRHSSRMTA